MICHSCGETRVSNTELLALRVSSYYLSKYVRSRQIIILFLCLLQLSLFKDYIKPSNLINFSRFIASQLLLLAVRKLPIYFSVIDKVSWIQIELISTRLKVVINAEYLNIFIISAFGLIIYWNMCLIWILYSSRQKAILDYYISHKYLTIYLWLLLYPFACIIRDSNIVVKERAYTI